MEQKFRSHWKQITMFFKKCEYDQLEEDEFKEDEKSLQHSKVKKLFTFRCVIFAFSIWSICLPLGTVYLLVMTPSTKHSPLNVEAYTDGSKISLSVLFGYSDIENHYRIFTFLHKDLTRGQESAARDSYAFHTRDKVGNEFCLG